MAIDPDCFAPGFKDRLTDLNKIHRELKPSPNAPGSVLVAGDPERINMRATDEAGGIKEKFERNLKISIIIILKYYSDIVIFINFRNFSYVNFETLTVSREHRQSF